MNGLIISRDLVRAASKPRMSSRESGFAYLMALFMILFMFIASSAAILNMRTDRRRQREEEMIWRGNQYIRAIRLYYRKTGHYPQGLDDLQKGLPELHFLRYSAYKDPLNASDGAWRFIYVNAAGQIIGSVKYASLQQMALMDLNGGKMPTISSGPPGMSSVLPFGSSNTLGQGSGGGIGAQPGQATPPPSTSSAPSPDSGSTQNPTSAQPGQTAPTTPSAPAGSGVFGNPIVQQPTGPVDGPVIGGFLTGVGSTVDQASVKVYGGAANYSQWEFIWNPIEDQERAVQQGLGQGQGALPGLLGPGGVGGAPAPPGGPGMGNPAPGNFPGPPGAGALQQGPQQVP